MVCLTITSIGHLFAYIDPASGSIILQVILAGAVGTLGYFYRPVMRVFRFLQVILVGAVGALGYFVFFRPIMRVFRFLSGRGSEPAEPAADPEKKAPEEPPQN